MKDCVLKYAPLILLVVGTEMWLVAFLFYEKIGLKIILISCMVCQLLLFLCCGIIIKKLYKQANSDSLTGIFNRRCFFTKMSAFLMTKLPISLIMIDVDNFKRINDSYGHSAGDEALKQLAEILRNNTRHSDIIARLGGEEFAVVMPQTSDENALKLAERIRQVIESKVFVFGSAADKMTVSIGVATTKITMNADCFLNYADKALYRAKETKNTIVIYE